MTSQTNYYGFEYIEDYFDQNSIEPVGYLYEQYDDNGTDHGYDDNGSDYGYNDDNGTDHGNDGNESDYADITTKICLMIMASQCFT